MKRIIITGLTSLSFVLLASCAAPVAEPDELDSAAESALEITNGLAPNGLAPNALAPNALAPNALAPNALAPNALSPDALASIQDPGASGDLSRMFLKYAVGCALSPSQSFNFSWIDSGGIVHQESYPGLLGIAPEWASGPLKLADQELVSGCLAARTNYYGVRVMLSLRYDSGVLQIVTETPEHTSYPYVEGAFWGNLFNASPYVSTCYNAQNVQHAHDAKRDCAYGHVDDQGEVEECGILHVVGPCKDRCSAPILPGLLGTLGQYYPSCSDSLHGTSTHVITTALP